MKKVLLSLIYFTFIIGFIKAQECHIYDMSLSKSACEPDNKFFLTIDFKHENTSDCFKLQGNGVKYGTYNYSQLPLTIGPLNADCKTEYEFAVVDCAKETCHLSKQFGKVCCEDTCKLSELKWTRFDCDSNGKFLLKINFNHNNTSDTFILSGLGSSQKYLYSSLPITVGPYVGDCTTNYEFSINDNDYPDCTIHGVIGKVCCTQQEECKIYDAAFEKTDCNADGNFYVFIKFKYQGHIGECVKITGNGHEYGSFKYDQQPIKLGPFKGDCTTNYGFVIRDCANEKCVTQLNVGKVCCTQPDDCKIYDAAFVKTDCNADGNFYVYIKFKYQGHIGECVKISGNGHEYGSFKYDQQPVKLGPFKGDCTTNYEFVIRDCANEKCAAELIVGKVCCTQPDDCKIYDAAFEKTDCNADGNFFVYIKFKYQGQTGECFTVSGNGHNYGSFKYNQQPIKLGPFKGDCTTNYGFVIRDCANEKCATELNVGKVCCTQPDDCKIYDAAFEKTDCNADGNFYVYIKFKYQGHIGECVKITGDGHEYGSFKYDQQPIKLGPFKGDCTTNYEFVIRDCANEKCAAELIVGKVCCEQKEDCKIYDAAFEKTDCNADGNFFVYIKFKYQGQTGECFTVSGNGHNYGSFKYNQLPIKLGPFKGDCTTNYGFVIRDCAIEKCVTELNVGKVCCTQPDDCKIYDAAFEKTDCNADGNFFVYIKFKYQGHIGECVKITGNGHEYGSFKYDQQPIKLGPFKGDCTTNYEFVIRDCANEKCAAELNVGKVCCEQNEDCKIYDAAFEKTDCNADGNFYVYIKFKYQGHIGECVKITGNGHEYGSFKYDQQPIKLGPFKGDCTTNYGFVIRDCANEKCATELNVGKVCCEMNDKCKLSELNIVKSDCDANKQFKVTINFNFANTSDSFIVKGNGIIYDTFAYTQLPIMIVGLAGDCHTNYEFIIEDRFKHDCSLSKVLGKVCCEKEEACVISELKAIPLHCSGSGEYSVKINFAYKGTKNVGFDVFDRNGPIGFYPYSALPLTIEHFKKSDLNYDLIKVCDNDNPNCCRTIEFKGIDCFGKQKEFHLTDIKSYFSGNKIYFNSSVEIPDLFNIEIYTISGKKISVQKLEKSDYQIIVESNDFADGVYLLKASWTDHMETIKYYYFK